MISGDFVHITDLDYLVTLRTKFRTCLESIALNQSYSLGGRSFNRANLAEVSRMIGEIEYAIKVNGGTFVCEEVADMSGGPKE